VAWEDIEERLHKVLAMKVVLPGGVVWLPNMQFSIDEWLVAATNDEFRELNIPIIRFLQSHWTIEKLLEFSGRDTSDQRSLSAMFMGRRAYLLFDDGSEYYLVAGIEPKGNRTLWRIVIEKVLQASGYRFCSPAKITNYRPELVPTELLNKWNKLKPSFAIGKYSAGTMVTFRWRHPAGSAPEPSGKRRHTVKLLTGWIGSWIHLPLSENDDESKFLP